MTKRQIIDSAVPIVSGVALGIVGYLAATYGSEASGEFIKTLSMGSEIASDIVNNDFVELIGHGAKRTLGYLALSILPQRFLDRSCEDGVGGRIQGITRYLCKVGGVTLGLEGFGDDLMNVCNATDYSNLNDGLRAFGKNISETSRIATYAGINVIKPIENFINARRPCNNQP